MFLSDILHTCKGEEEEEEEVSKMMTPSHVHV